MAGASAEQGRPLPWIEVPGFTPPQVQSIAAESAAENGIMVSLPMPATAQAENAEPAAATTDTASATNVAPQTADNSATNAEQATPSAAPANAPIVSAPTANAPAEVTPPAASPAATASTTEATPHAQPAQPKAAAMPKDDDWDLPAGFDSKNAFVPIEAE